jgi:hypothetical protein
MAGKGLAELIAQDSGYDYGDILPIRRNKKTGDKGLAVPGLVSGAINSVYDAVTLPGDVYSGEREATPENTLNAAMSMMGVGSAIPRRANEMRALGGIKLPERPPNYSSVLTAHADEPLHLFSTARGSTYAQYPDASTIRNRASGVSSPGSGSEGGLQPKSRKTLFMDEKDVTDIGGLHQNREFPGLLEPVPGKPGYIGIRMQEDYGPRKAGEFIPGTIRPYSTKPEVGAVPVEYFSSTPKGIHFGSKITHVQKHTPKKAKGGAIIIDDGNPAKRRKLI